MSVLHLGCGKQPLPEWVDDRDETRLDINPAARPDVVASILDVGPIGPFDVVYSSHVLEHVYPHQTEQALRESRRVLKDGGYAVHIVPDTEDVEPTEDVLYESEAGPVTGADLFYGMRSMVVGNPYMAHHNRFTRHNLARDMVNAGFSKVLVRRMSAYNLIAVGIK